MLAGADVRCHASRAEADARGAKNEISKIGEQFSKELREIKESLQSEIKTVIAKIEDSGSDGQQACQRGGSDVQDDKMNFLYKVISAHPCFSFVTFIFILVLVFVSGHFDECLKVFGGN